MDNIKTTIFKQEQPQSWCCWLGSCCLPNWCCWLGSCCLPDWCCWQSKGCNQQVTYRIPALIYISKNKTYLAFAEKRKTPSDTDAEVLVMRRGKWVDDKNAVQWSSGHQLLSSACLPNHRSMNPCPVYERESETLFLFFIRVPIGISEGYQINKNTNQARLCYITSEDTGKTWSDITDLTADVIGEQEKDWATFAVGPGHGVQMKSGRLIIPAYAYFKSTNGLATSRAFAFYSDDKGSTWVVGEPIEGESNECQMAEITDSGTLYCNARSTSGHRVEALSSNSGKTFGKPLTVQKLKETGKGCQGSVLKIHYPDQGIWLLYSHPSDEKERKDLGIYVNKSPLDDFPNTWKMLSKTSDGPSGYSDLAECEKTEYAACLTECGEKEIAFKFFKIDDAVDSP